MISMENSDQSTNAENQHDADTSDEETDVVKLDPPIEVFKLNLFYNE